MGPIIRVLKNETRRQKGQRRRCEAEVGLM